MSFQAYWFNPVAGILAAEGRGVRLPRMSTTKRLALGLGVGDAGTLVYDLTLDEVYSWDGSAWSAAGSTDGVTMVANVAALKALDVSSHSPSQSFGTLGYYSANDGGQGSYYYDPMSVAADNGGTVIAPTTGAGRYLLMVGDVVTPRQFGAVGDGVADDTSRITTMLSWASGASVPVDFTAGLYVVTGGTWSASGIVVRFSGGILKLTTGTLVITVPIVATYRQIFQSSLATPVRITRGAGGYFGPGSTAFNDRVVAEWFGAVGDGVVDNAVPLQQWLNAVGNGMSALMAGGLYNVTAPLVWPASMRWVRINGNGSRIAWSGAASPSSGVMQVTNAGNILAYRCELSNLVLDASGLAGYALLARSSGGAYSANTMRFVECLFERGTVAQVQAGDYSQTNNDCDFAHWQFDHCSFISGSGATNVVVDAPNIVGFQFLDCSFGASNPASDRPTSNVVMLTGANATFSTCFFDRVAQGGWSIVNRGLVATFTGCDTESTRFLLQEASSNLSNLTTSLVNLRLSNAGGENPSGSFSIWALSGTVVLDGTPVVSGGAVFGVRADGRLTINGSSVGGLLTGTTTSAADVVAPSYCSVVMDGKRQDDIAYLNSNRYFDLWSGSASNDLPLGFAASGSGTFTISRAGTSSAEFPKNGYGRFCCKITTTTGATSGNVLDGIVARVQSQSRRGAGPFVAMVSGFIEAASGTNAAPSVSIASYTWSGAAWVVAASQVRVCSVDSSGRFWGVASIAPAAASIQSGYVEAYCGMGSGSSGIIYLSELSILRTDGTTLADPATGVYPDLGRLKAFSVVPKSATLDATFASGSSWWTLPAGWAVSGNAALHSSGTGALSQDIGLSPRSRRMLLSFRVNGMTSGSVTPRVSGTAGNVVSNSTSTTQVTFTVSGVGVVPTAGATYTVGGVTYTVDWATSTRIRATGGVPTTTSGTLTKTAGTGDASISFSAIDPTQIVEILGGTGLKVTFTTRGVSTPPVAGDTYTVGGVTYTVASATATRIVATATTSAVPSIGPSTMTRVTGSGDATITYQYSVATSMLEFAPTSDFNGAVTNVLLQFPAVCGSDIAPEDYVRAGQMPLTTGGLSLSSGVDLQPPVITQGAAAPLAGTWRAGSVVYNSAPAVGQPTYWVCTVGGTPGTWVAGPNL